MLERFLREAQFARVYGLLQQEAKIHTKDCTREQRFLAASCWMARSGAQWRLLAAEYGAWNSGYKRFARWNELGVWARLFEQVADDPDLQSVLIDATVVRAHACAAGAPQTTVGRRRRGWAARAAASAPRSTASSTRWVTR
jgi:transposase